LQLWCALASVPSDRRLLALLSRIDQIDGAPSAVPEDIRRVLRDSATRQRLRAGSPLLRSWDDEDRERLVPPQPPEQHEGGGTLLIAFSGADAALGGGANGGIPSHEFVRSCRKAGVQKAIFVRDVLKSWYLRGLGGAGGDCFDDIVTMLRAEIEAIMPSRVLTMGSSAGGYAAIRAAIALHADGAIAFAPQIAIDPDLRRQRGLPKASFDDLLEGLRAIGDVEGFARESLDELVRNLVRQECDSALGARGGSGAHGAPAYWGEQHANIDCAHTKGASARGGVRIEIHAGDADPGDVSEALLLEQTIGACATAAGLSCCVKVHPGRDHNLVVDMRDTGELHKMLCCLAAEDGDELPTIR